MKIIEADRDAHIIGYGDFNIICGAIFGTGKTFVGTPVACTDTPVTYIFESTDDTGTKARLTVCDPDMRRPYRAHMGQLTDEDVIAEEKPHETTIVLNGLYSVTGGPEDTAVRHDMTAGTTAVTFTTVRGENHSFALTVLR